MEQIASGLQMELEAAHRKAAEAEAEAALARRAMEDVVWRAEEGALVHETRMADADRRLQEAQEAARAHAEAADRGRAEGAAAAERAAGLRLRVDGMAAQLAQLDQAGAAAARLLEEWRSLAETRGAAVARAAEMAEQQGQDADAARLALQMVRAAAAGSDVAAEGGAETPVADPAAVVELRQKLAAERSRAAAAEEAAVRGAAARAELEEQLAAAQQQCTADCAAMEDQSREARAASSAAHEQLAAGAARLTEAEAAVATLRTQLQRAAEEAAHRGDETCRMQAELQATKEAAARSSAELERLRGELPQPPAVDRLPAFPARSQKGQANGGETPSKARGPAAAPRRPSKRPRSAAAATSSGDFDFQVGVDAHPR